MYKESKMGFRDYLIKNKLEINEGTGTEKDPYVPGDKEYRTDLKGDAYKSAVEQAVAKGIFDRGTLKEFLKEKFPTKDLPSGEEGLQHMLDQVKKGCLKAGTDPKSKVDAQKEKDDAEAAKKKASAERKEKQIKSLIPGGKKSKKNQKDPKKED